MAAALAQQQQQLSTWRSRGTRASEQVVQHGIGVLENGKLGSMGDEAWAFLEQLALAALDIGRLDIADDCLDQLMDEFPGSPRVERLRGIRIEADGDFESALGFYEEALKEDDTNGEMWKRKIAVLRSQGQRAMYKAVEELVAYLDTFYTDVEGWLELADMYSEINLYGLSLQALSHVLLLAPQNSFYALRFAETAYTAADVSLALKMFLHVIDMDDSVTSPPGNAAKRAWWGVKLTCQRLLSSPDAATSESQTRPPTVEHLRMLDGLASEQIAGMYGKEEEEEEKRTSQERDITLLWLDGKTRQ